MNVETDADGQRVTEATVKLRIAGAVRHEVAEGDGPVKRWTPPCEKRSTPTFPNLAEMQLVDYKVRVINSEAGTAGRRSRGHRKPRRHDVWGTVGVSENVIEASWIALVDAFEYKLWKDEESQPPLAIKTAAAFVGR